MTPWPLRRYLLVALGVGLAATVAFGGLLYLAAPSSRGAPADFYSLGDGAGDALPVYWAAPEFSFTSQRGQTVTTATLRGRVWIADFIFTRCTTVCPLITARMTSLQRRLAEPELRFVSFSVDPAHDTREALEAYARKWSPEEARWDLLVTDPAGLEEVARGMKVAVAPSDDPQNPIIHSNLFILVDQAGQVRGVYNSSEPPALERLERDVRRLLAAEPPEKVLAVKGQSGAALYASLRCAACHDDSRIAPPLGGIAGRTVKLEGGGQVTADAEYLKRSLTHPGAELVAGYLPLMPGYGHELSEAQLDALVSYLAKAEATPIGARPAAVELVVDPICKMKVRAAGDTLHLDRDGKRFYFCSEVCRDRFAKAGATGPGDPVQPERRPGGP